MWSLQGGAHAGWLGPAMIRASAPRPLALAGVTQITSTSNSLSYIFVHIAVSMVKSEWLGELLE